MAVLSLFAAFGVASAQTNSDPSFPSSAPTALSVAENSAATTEVGTVAATDDDDDTLTYSLGGADGSSFAIGSSSGKITVGSGTTLNFEATKNSYSVTVSVHDGKDSAGDADTSVDATRDVTISVTDELEPPAAPGAPTVSAASTTSLSVSWTAPTNTGPAITDYDWRWKLQSATSWTEKTDTTTTATSATIAGLTAGTAYHVAVRAKNAEGTGDWSASGSGTTSAQANRSPAFSGAPFTRTVAENSGTGTKVGAAVTATDPDGNALNYSLSGDDASSFAIGLLTGQITVAAGTALNFEATKKSYSVTVTASDGALSASAGVTINVTDVNEAPAFASNATTSVSVDENNAARAEVTTLTATDPDGDGLTYSLDTTSDTVFDISSAGAITVTSANALDHEDEDSYTLTVKASDGTLSDTHELTVNVGDENEPPDAPAAPSVSAVSGTSDSLSVSWTAPNASGRPAIDDYDVRWFKGSADPATESEWTGHDFSGTGTSTTIASLDSGSAFRVQVRAGNDEGDGDWSPSGTGSTFANANPTFPTNTATAFTVAENNGANGTVGTTAATDPDADALTYSLDTTSDAVFDISASGVITVTSANALNFEATESYSLTVSVHDGKDINGVADTSVDATHALTVNVDDENEPPDAPAAPSVSAVSGTSDSLSVSWTAPNASGRPAIDDYDVRWFKGSADPATDSEWTGHDFSGTGTSTTIASLDSGSAFRVQVRAGNNEGDGDWSPSGTGSTFANANPTFPTNTPTEFTMAENNAVGAAVGTTAAVDPDNDGLRYSLDATSDALFDINANGAITVTNANGLNFEAAASHALTVSVHDGKDIDGNADATVDDTHTLTINVEDEEEPPPAPGTPSLTAASTSLSVSWTAPNVADRPAIDDYDVRWFQGSADPATDSEWTDHAHGSTETETTITGLIRGAPYRVQVMASNAEGDGDWSPSGAASTIAPPSPTVSSVALVSTPSHDTNDDDTNETYAQGDVVRARVTFDAAVDVAGDPTLRLRLKAGAAPTMAFDASKGRTNVTTLDFTYTVVPDDTSSGLALPANGLSAPTGTMIRAENSLVDATLTYTAVAANAAHQVDGVGPKLASSIPILFQSGLSTVPIGGTVGVEAYFPGTVNVTGAPRIKLVVGRNERYAGYRSRFLSAHPSGDRTIVSFRYTVVEGDADADGVVVSANGLELNGGKFTNPLGNASTTAQIAHRRVGPWTPVDGVRPAVATANVYDTTLKVTFKEPLGAAASLANGAFTVKKTPQGGTEEGVSLSGSPSIGGSTVTLTLAAAVVATDGSVKVTYTRPGTGSANRIVDAVGNEANSFTDQQVANITGSTNTAPSFPETVTTSFEVEENNAAGAAVGTVEATDPDGDTLTYSLDATSNAVFDISAGAITVTAANALDFEATTSYSLTVSVSDGKNPEGGADSSVDATIAVTVDVTNALEPPEAPSKPTVSSASASSLDVTWTATAVAGRPPITGYNVRYFEGTADPADDANWSEHEHDGTGTETTISDLNAETEYRVQVQAVNADGASGWSASGSGTTGVAHTVPSFGAVSTLSVEENSDADTEVGTVAATDGDGDTLTYSLTSAGTDHDSFAIDGEGAITVATGATLDYEAQPSYSITVRVTDGEDENGDPETEPTIDDTVAVTIDLIDQEEPPEAPRAPTVNAVAGSPESLTVTWVPPDVTGRPPITGYGVRYKQSSESAWTSHPHGGTRTTTTITGLEEDADYDVQVQATNADGTSDWSISGSGTAGAANANPSFPETAPTELSVAENSAVDTEVGTVAATDPDADDTLSYLLDSASDAVFDIDSSGTITVADADALDHEGTPSWSVTVSVHDGKDSEGEEEATPTVDARIVVTVEVTDVEEPPPAPEAPTVAAASATSLTVTWAAPEVTGRPPVTGYGVRYRKSSESAWTSHAHAGAGTTATIPGLEAETGYDVQVQATNDEGTSDWSTSGSATTPAETVIAPSAPAAPRVSAASETSLTVRWSAPSDPGSASSIADYDLRYYAGAADPAAEADWIEEGEIDGPPDPGSSVSATITGLEPDTAYQVQVRAFGVAESPWSASGSATTPGQDTTRPTVAITSAATFPANARFTVTLAFSEPVSGLTPAAITVVNGVAGNPRGSGAVYLVDVTPNADFSGTVTVAVSAGVAADADGNFNLGGSAGFAVDTRAPTVQVATLDRAIEEWTAPTDAGAATASAIVSYPSGDGDGDDASAGAATAPAEDVTAPPDTGSRHTVTLTYDEPLDGASRPPADAFTVRAGGSALTVTSVAVRGARVQLTLEAPVTAGQSVTVGYAVPTGAAAAPIRDLAGNAAHDLAATVVGVDGAAAEREPRHARVNRAVLPYAAATLQETAVAAIAERVDSDGSTATRQGSTPAAAMDVASAREALPAAEHLLSAAEFVVPIGGAPERGAAHAPSVSLWGKGAWHSLSGDRASIDWSGGLRSFLVGGDLRVIPELLAGVAVAWSESTLDYRDRDADSQPVGGEHETELISVHPYVGVSVPEAGLRFWVSAGYGWGTVRVDDGTGVGHTDPTWLLSGAAGGSGRLLATDGLIAGGTTMARLKGYWSLVRVEVDDGSRMASALETRRLRVLLEGSHAQALAWGARLQPAVDVGLRYEEGDGPQGAGLELGGRLRYVDPRLGLVLQGHGRLLAAHGGAYEEWGAGGLLRLEFGLGGRGLWLSVAPSWGELADGGAHAGGVPVAATGSGGRLEAQAGYGLSAGAGGGVLTPYGGVALGSAGDSAYRGGVRLQMDGLGMGVEGRFGGGADGYGVTLDGTLSY